MKTLIIVGRQARHGCHAHHSHHMPVTAIMPSIQQGVVLDDCHYWKNYTLLVLERR